MERKFVTMDIPQVGYSVNQKHYVAMQPIEVMQELMTPEQFKGFCLGNAIKYKLRADHKGQHDSDLDKYRQYMWWVQLVSLGQKVDPSMTVPEGFKPSLF